MRRLPLLLMLPAMAHAQGVDPGWAQALESYWAAKDVVFSDPQKSPLPPAARADFTGLERFPAHIGHRVEARFTAAAGKAFNMPTTGSRRPLYQSVGTLHFSLEGKPLQLTVYKNLELADDPRYADHLFVPFTDLTNGETTYGGGRYLDLVGPLGERVELDFNRAYNPYCAYGGRYSCPIVPMENHLEVAVRAGVKAYDH
ncbi:MAG: DUF1684 domain-containing protein [Flavobacteriales bacterium]|jgi:uncharacterized protein (DUF1684 family)|nr:DUF1684 domain-containing protein [Flavobacteriales bacterium]